MWDPRHVCTLPTFTGFSRSLMSKMRTPRSRSALTVSWTPWPPQSMRPLSPSPETNSRSPYTDTSLCEAGQKYPSASVGADGFEISQIWKPL